MTKLVHCVEKHSHKFIFMLGWVIGSLPVYILLWKIDEICR